MEEELSFSSGYTIPLWQVSNVTHHYKSRIVNLVCEAMSCHGNITIGWRQNSSKFIIAFRQSRGIMPSRNIYHAFISSNGTKVSRRRRRRSTPNATVHPSSRDQEEKRGKEKRPRKCLSNPHPLKANIFVIVAVSCRSISSSAPRQ